MLLIYIICYDYKIFLKILVYMSLVIIHNIVKDNSFCLIRNKRNFPLVPEERERKMEYDRIRILAYLLHLMTRK